VGLVGENTGGILNLLKLQMWCKFVALSKGAEQKGQAGRRGTGIQTRKLGGRDRNLFTLRLPSWQIGKKKKTPGQTVKR